MVWLPLTRDARPQPQAVPLGSSTARWIPPGEFVEVAGFKLPGMVYVGSRLSTVKTATLRPGLGQPEPALIDPTLHVDTRAVDSRAVNAPVVPSRPVNFGTIPYRLSYSSLPPADRAGYLRWLAGGRSAADAYVSYAFLFLYGLERRLLHDSARAGLPAAEVQAICFEVERLSDLYGNHFTFQRCAAAFRNVIRLLGGPFDLDETVRAPMHHNGWELPLPTRVALSALAAKRRPLPAEWALSWVRTAPEVFLRMPAERCPDEFRDLFFLRYRERFGDGIPLRPSRTHLKASYHPASPSFESFVTVKTSLPNVAGKRATLDLLQTLAEQCTYELDPFSRWVGRNGETASPLALALLPPVLARGRGNATSQALDRWLKDQLDEREHGERALAVLESSALLIRWPSKTSGSPSRRELELLSDFLATRDLGLEPDVKLGGPALTGSRNAVLFRLPAERRDKPAPAFARAAALLPLAALVAAADGGVSDAEERRLRQHLETLDLEPADRIRLAARFRWLAADPPTLSRAKKSVESLREEDRRALGPFLVSLAAADGHLASEEVKVLSMTYPLLGLDPRSLYSEVHQLMSAEGAPADEPVPIRPAEASPGFAVPRPADAAAATRPVALDTDRVRVKLEETARVSKLLGEIFLDEEPAAPAPPPAAPVGDGEPAVAGLDGAHSALLRRLAEEATWERVRIERLAGDLGLLPDGALEVINEAAFAICGAPLLEGDEQIEIDQEILQEMLT